MRSGEIGPTFQPNKKAKSLSATQVHNNDDTSNEVDELPNPNPKSTPIINVKRPPGRRG